MTIKLRRGTALQWTAANPILSEGEMGLEMDSRRFKFGDGIRRWSDLEYAGTTSELSIETAARVAVDSSLDARLDVLESASSGFGGGGGNQISAGTQLAPAGSTVLFSNANGVTFGLSNSSVLTASVAAGLPSPVNFSAGTTSSDLGSVVLSNSNGISFGLNGSTITAAHNALTSQSNQNVTAGNGGFAFQTISFSNANGFSFGTSAGSAITGSYTVPAAQTGISGIQVSDTTYNSGTVTFRNSNGISFGSSDANGITASYTVPIQTNQTGGIYVTAQSTGQSSSSTYDLRTLSMVGDGIISIGWSNSTLRVSATQSNQAFSAAGGSSAFQTLSFGDTNSVSFTNTNGSVGIASIKLQMFAVSNTTQNTSGTANHTALSFGGNGIASVAVTGGSVVVSALGVLPGVSNLGNTAGSTGTISVGNFVLVGSNNITLSQSTGAAGSAATVTILGWQHISSYENCAPFASNISGTFNAASVSHAVAFLLPRPISASFLRIPVVMTTNSTTLATLASATASASNSTAQTWNAVIYSLGTGASSKSLISVASGSGSASFSQRISITNSTQYSISQGVSFPLEGGAGTNRTTQYSISNTNYSFTTNQIATEFSGSRFMDIPFANSLSPGPYWLVFGYSSASASGGAGLGGMSNCNVRYSNHYGASQADIAFGIMGSTNFSSGGLLGAGSFSTAGGGTTSAFPISAISSSASNPRWCFQLLRSA